MSKLLRLSPDGKLIIDAEFYVYKEFKPITQKEVDKVGLYLYLMYNPLSELFKWNTNEKKEEAIRQTGIKITKDIEKAEEKYQELLNTPALDSIKSSLATLHTVNGIQRKINTLLQDRMEQDNLTFEEIKSIQEMVKLVVDNTNKLPVTIKTLKELEESYRAESQQDSSLIGQQEIGFVNGRNN